jgi:hypothetical protein
MGVPFFFLLSQLPFWGVRRGCRPSLSVSEGDLVFYGKQRLAWFTWLANEMIFLYTIADRETLYAVWEAQV